MVPTQSIPWHCIWDQRRMGVGSLAAVQERLSMAVAGRPAKGVATADHGCVWAGQRLIFFD